MTVELERELGLQLPPDVANRYRGQPVLVASSVRLIETEFRWSEDYREGSVAGVIRLLSDLAPETFVGHAVDFTNLPVQSKTGRGLWVGFHRRSQLFVVPTDPALLAGVEVGDRIRLRGTVRLMPSAGQPTRQFALDAATAKRAADEEVFVEASEIEKTTAPPAT